MTPPFSPSMSFSSSRTSDGHLQKCEKILIGKEQKVVKTNFEEVFVAAAASSGKSEWDNETGTVYYVEEELFSNKQNRPVLRTGRKQALPLPTSHRQRQKVAKSETDQFCWRERLSTRNGLPEIALIGRSNVGKSSLQICSRKVRVMPSYRRILVQRGPLITISLTQNGTSADLPGYGFAKQLRRKFYPGIPSRKTISKRVRLSVGIVVDRCFDRNPR